MYVHSVTISNVANNYGIAIFKISIDRTILLMSLSTYVTKPNLHSYVHGPGLHTKWFSYLNIYAMLYLLCYSNTSITIILYLKDSDELQLISSSGN